MKKLKKGMMVKIIEIPGCEPDPHIGLTGTIKEIAGNYVLVDFGSYALNEDHNDRGNQKTNTHWWVMAEECEPLKGKS